MTTGSSTEIPGIADTRIAAAGEEWDAVRTDRFLGLQAADRLGAAAGPVIVEPSAMYFLVQPGSTRGWDLPQSTGLGEKHYVVLPAAGRNHPPGPYWLLPPARPLADADNVRRALEAAAALVRLNLDTVRQDIDHALSQRVELPPRSVIDAGTDALVAHLCRFMNYNYGPDDAKGSGIGVRNLLTIAERHLDVPVRPTSQTSHRTAYVYWHAVANLTAGFRDLYVASCPAELKPPA
ncbi:hypothetical protein ACIQ9K_34980 [Streptomyces microflavus]|uniref:hypothetical protein n=1 Tax=Streptomyces microflavus TaxID=1919 RepID=UPI0033CB5F75